MAGEAFGVSGDSSKADVKGALAALGQTVRPDAAFTSLPPPPPGQNVAIVVLERVRAGETPEYCIHGYTTCVGCQELCWLGHETERVVSSRQAYPLCIECARARVPPGTPARHLQDHRRADGPH